MKGIASKSLLFFPLLLLLTGCGSSGDGGGDGGTSTTPQTTGRTCVWDTSAWDNCDLDS